MSATAIPAAPAVDAVHGAAAAMHDAATTTAACAPATPGNAGLVVPTGPVPALSPQGEPAEDDAAAPVAAQNDIALHGAGLNETEALEFPASGQGRASAEFPVNEVRLTGRISAILDPRQLPSGDSVVMARLVVARDRRPGGRRDGSASERHPGVDTIDLACFTAATQRSVQRVGADGHAEITGVLRRRFFRAGGAPASRYEVEVRRVRRLRG